MTHVGSSIRRAVNSSHRTMDLSHRVIDSLDHPVESSHRTIDLSQRDVDSLHRLDTFFCVAINKLLIKQARMFALNFRRPECHA